MTSNKELLDEIMDETILFNNLSLDEKRKEWQRHQVIPPAFPLGEGRQLLTNQKAVTAFNKLIKQLLSKDSEIKARHSRETLRAKAQASIGHLFLELKNLTEEINESEFLDYAYTKFENILNAELKAVRIEHTRIVPCHVFAPYIQFEFNIGPVQFSSRNVWLQKISETKSWRKFVEQVWQGNVKPEELEHLAWKTEPAPSGAREANAVIAAFQSRQWTASIHLKNYDLQVSQSRAEGITDIALGILGLILDPSNAANLSFAGDDLSNRHDRVALSEEGNIIGGWSMRPHGVHSKEQFIKQLFDHEETKRFIGAAGINLQTYVDTTPLHRSSLVERWTNAIDWYRQAIKERTDYMSLVKYGCAIDIITGANGDLTEMTNFCEALFAMKHDETEKKRHLRDLLSEVYNRGRSQLAHGSLFGLLTDMREERLRAHEITREILLNATVPLSELIIKGSRILKLKKNETKAFREYLFNRASQEE